MPQAGQDRMYFEYSTGGFEHLIVGDVEFDPGDTRDNITDPVTVRPTTYDQSPVDAFSTSHYSPSLLDTSPSDSSSPSKSTLPNIDLYASEASFVASPLLGNGDSPLVFGEHSPSAPGFYPFVGSTGSDSPGDPLTNLNFPDLVSGPAAGFPDFGLSPVGDSAYAPQVQPQRPLPTDDPSTMMATGLSPNKRAKLTLDEDRSSPGRPQRGGPIRPLQPALPHTTSSSQTPKPKLRSASSSSKNFAPRSTETSKERKERDSHNLVEKNYRHRLNAQYEGLMNALPPEMHRASAAGGSGDQAEKPLSKGEVLEKSAAYIQELERDHARLRGENEALSRGIERLCSMFAGGGGVGDLGRPGG